MIFTEFGDDFGGILRLIYSPFWVFSKWAAKISITTYNTIK